MSIKEVAIRNRKELEEIAVREIEIIEEGLKIIGSKIPISAQTVIDILCHDDNGQLVIFKLNIDEDDLMLFEGLKALNEVNKIKQMLKFHYQDFNISKDKDPRLVLLAPSFSENLMTIASHISGIEMDLYEWEYLEFEGSKGLRIKPISLSKNTEERREHVRRSKKREGKAEFAEKPHAPQEVILKPEPVLKTEDKKEKPKKRSRLF